MGHKKNRQVEEPNILRGVQIYPLPLLCAFPRWVSIFLNSLASLNSHLNSFMGRMNPTISQGVFSLFHPHSRLWHRFPNQYPQPGCIFHQMGV